MAKEVIGISIEAQIDKQSFNKAKDDIQGFNKRIESETAINLSINVANLKQQLANVKQEIKKANASGDTKLEIQLTATQERLKQQLTQAQRELRNFARTGEKDVSVLGKLFDNVTNEIQKTRLELEKTGKSTAKLDNIAKSLKEGKISAQQAQQALQNINKTTFDNVIGSAKNLFKAFIGFEVLQQVGQFLKDSVQYSANLEQTAVVFENITGSAIEARDIIQQIQTLANKTPFEFEGLANSAKLLMSVAGIGKDELIPTLTALGDIASSQGKDIGQAVEAFNDAIVGEFERLKEFGVRASVEGDKVKFTFKGQTTEVAKTTTAIQDYILTLSEAEGVAGSMEKQSETLTGKWATLKDEVKSTGGQITDFFIPALKDLIDFFGILINVFKIAGNGFVGFVKLGITAFSALLESNYNTVKFISDNWTIFAKNSQILFKNLGINLGKSFDNLPGAVAVVLKNTLSKFDSFITSIGNAFGVDISKKLGLGKIINTLDTATKGIGFVDLTAGFQELPKFNNDLSITKKSFDSFLKTSDDLANNFSEIKASMSATNAVAKTTGNTLKNVSGGGTTDTKKTGGGSKTATDTLKKQIEEEEKLEADRLENFKKYQEEQKKLYNDNQKEKIDVLKKGYETYVDILDDETDKSKKSIDKFSDDIDKLKDNIDDLNSKLSELETDRATTLGERNIAILERESEIQKELNDLKQEEFTIERLNKENDLNKELVKLLDEKKLIQSKATKEELDEAKRINELSPTAKFLEDFELKKKALEEERSLKELEIKDLETQKASEEAILQSFSDKKLEIDTRYAELTKELKQSITDDSIAQDLKVIDSLEKVRLKALETAQALKLAQSLANSGTNSSTANNTKTVTNTFNVNNQIDLDSAVNKINNSI